MQQQTEGHCIFEQFDIPNSHIALSKTPFMISSGGREKHPHMFGLG